MSISHHRSRVLTSLGAALSCVAFAAAMTSPAHAADKKADKKTNVLFLIADDLNCDLHCYGHPIVQSPNIDKLAGRGVQFDYAYCQYPLCSPSRTSFLTGRRPNETQILTNSGKSKTTNSYEGHPHFRDFIPDTVTLPELYRKNGYFVARVGKLYHYGVPNQIGTDGLDDPQSWDHVVNPAGRDKAEENAIFSLVPGSYGGTLSWLKTEGTDYEHTDGLSATAAISLMEQHQNEPFFLAVGCFRPHTPYVAPKKYFDMYPLENIKLPKLSDDDKSRTPAAAYASAKKDQEDMTDLQRREAMQAYYASISFMDSQMGRVLDALDRLGLADNTVVVMTSDHGYHMYQHGLWQKMSLFENSARVPMIFAAPGAKGKGRTSSIAEMVDLYPTLADLCGLKVADYLDGKSQRAVLDDTSKSVKSEAYSQVRGKANGYSIRTPQYRYTLWADGADGHQLYDMQKDFGEMKNLADDPQYASVVKELKEKLIAYSANQPKSDNNEVTKPAAKVGAKKKKA